MRSPETRVLHCLTAAALMSLGQAALAVDNTLAGWALMPALTSAEGPTTGQFTGTGFGANSSLLPILSGQSVQGFSAVLAGPTAGSYLFMPDNGFGSRANSADALLRLYALTPDFRTASGGSGSISAAGFSNGAPMAGFTAGSYITLSDPDNLLGQKIQADYLRYYNKAANPLVDPTIRDNRLLTGADYDIESVRQDKNGNLWFGEEFGPYLLKTDASGKVLRAEVGTPGVFSPDNPAVLNGNTTANLGGSRGFEGMAINPAGDRLYTLLEGTVTGDPAKSLRISEFNIDTERYTGQSWLYQLDANGSNIGDMTAINDHEFLVIERNGATATSGGTAFKKIFRIDTQRSDGSGHVFKQELVDLMNIADPNDLNRDGSTTFTFPFVTIESVLIVDDHTLLVANDNNFPGGGGRSLAPDATEFLLIHTAAAVPEPGTGQTLAVGLALLAGVGRLSLRRCARPVDSP